MRRYVVRPMGWQQYVDYAEREVSSGEPLTVYERERGPIDTGVLDASGNKIFATDDIEVGFLTEELRELARD